MTKKFTVIHRRDINNVGDMASNPLQYFSSPSDYEVFDITNIRREPIPFGPPIIIGGGGLISNDFFGEVLRDLTISNDKVQLYEMFDNRWKLSNPINRQVHIDFEEKYKDLIHQTVHKLKEDTGLKILWGVGHNGEIPKKPLKDGRLTYPEWLLDFDMIGIRDFKQDYEWVPCASCMHPALRQKYPIRNQVIWFEHKKQLLKDFGTEPIPRFVNSGGNIEQTIELLGSAEVILTNSYHGAYWGTLMKKKVVVVGPWSSKFLAMKHRPFMVEKLDSWKDVVDDTTTHNDALDECIARTERYWKAIKERC